MLRAIIVDDEPLARAMIREYLAPFDEVEVVAECANGRQALEAIRAQAPDLVFLDIQMPGLDGFEVLAQLDPLPHVIFSTAFDTFALQAFETGAVDYLLKPYDRARFRKAVERVIEQHRLRRHDPDRLVALLEAARRPAAYPDQLFVRVGERIVPIAVRDVVWAEAAGDYTKLHTGRGHYLCNLGIGTLEQRLDPSRFTRVHRSALIALPHLVHLVSDGEGGYVATLSNRAQLRVSRSYAAKVRDWIV